MFVGLTVWTHLDRQNSAGRVSFREQHHQIKSAFHQYTQLGYSQLFTYRAFTPTARVSDGSTYDHEHASAIDGQAPCQARWAAKSCGSCQIGTLPSYFVCVIQSAKVRKSIAQQPPNLWAIACADSAMPKNLNNTTRTMNIYFARHIFLILLHLYTSNQSERSWKNKHVFSRVNPREQSWSCNLKYLRLCPHNMWVQQQTSTTHPTVSQTEGWAGCPYKGE